MGCGHVLDVCWPLCLQLKHFPVFLPSALPPYCLSYASLPCEREGEGWEGGKEGGREGEGREGGREGGTVEEDKKIRMILCGCIIGRIIYCCKFNQHAAKIIIIIFQIDGTPYKVLSYSHISQKVTHNDITTLKIVYPND